MSENIFGDCKTTGEVLRAFHGMNFVDAGAQDCALARIRELTPPTVSKEARERAREVLRDLVNDEMVSPGCSLHYAIDRIIDALGYTPARIGGTDE